MIRQPTPAPFEFRECSGHFRVPLSKSFPKTRYSKLDTPGCRRRQAINRLCERPWVPTSFATWQAAVGHLSVCKRVRHVRCLVLHSSREVGLIRFASSFRRGRLNVGEPFRCGFCAIKPPASSCLSDLRCREVASGTVLCGRVHEAERKKLGISCLKRSQVGGNFAWLWI